MIKTKHIHKTVWLVVILFNILFITNLYMDVNLKAQRLVFRINEKVIADPRIGGLKNKYLFSDNTIGIKELISGKKESLIYIKDRSQAIPFLRYQCISNKNMIEYSRTDSNINYPEKNEQLHKIVIKIPVFIILSSYFKEKLEFNSVVRVDEISVPMRVNYFNYKSSCEYDRDWVISF